MTKINNFFSDLISGNGELEDLYSNHVAENDEVLPHVLMGDLTRYVVGSLDDPTLIGETQRILDYFEASLHSGDEEIKNILNVSFLENLEPQDSGYQLIRKRLGRELLARLKEIEDFYS